MNLFNGHSAGQEMNSTLAVHLVVHVRVHKSPPLDPSLASSVQSNLYRIFPECSFWYYPPTYG